MKERLAGTIGPYPDTDNMFYSEKAHQKHLMKVMDRIGIPEIDSAPLATSKLSFVRRVDLLADYCEKLRDSLKQVVEVALKTARHAEGEDWDKIDTASKLVKQSEEIAK